MQGFSRETAKAMVDEPVRERHASIRGNGLVKLLAGVFLVAIPVLTTLAFLRQCVIPARTSLVTIGIGLVGMWFLINGAMMVFAPKTETGEVTAE